MNKKNDRKTHDLRSRCTVCINMPMTKQPKKHTHRNMDEPTIRTMKLFCKLSSERIKFHHRTRTRTAQIAIIVVYGERARNCCWSIVNEYTVDGASSLKCLNNMHSGNWRPKLPSDLRTLCFAWNSSVGMQQFCEATSEQRTYFIKRFLALYKI